MTAIFSQGDQSENSRFQVTMQGGNTGMGGKGGGMPFENGQRPERPEGRTTPTT